MSAELCSAFTIARMFDLKVAEAATFADTLDGLDAGLYLVDADGRLIHANAAGQAILDVRDILHEIRGHLAARDPTINQTLRDVFMAAGQGDSALGARGIAVPIRRLFEKTGTARQADLVKLVAGYATPLREPGG